MSRSWIFRLKGVKLGDGMQVLLENAPLFAFLGDWEIILMLSLVLILLGAKLPALRRGLRQGMREFRKALEEVDDATGDAGKSVGGIYGKAAAEALTPDNQT